MTASENNERTRRIEEKLKELLVEYAIVDVPSEEISIDEKINNIITDSIYFIKIIVALETEFEFEFEEDDLEPEKYTTLHDIVGYVEKMMDKSNKVEA